MSKGQIIKELALEVETARRDYETVVEQRDWERKRHEQRDSVNRINAAAKAEAAIQEKVDGIRAGLIPVEDMRKHLRQGFNVTVSGDSSAHGFSLFFWLGETDRVALAIHDAILKEDAPKSKYASSGYVFPPVLGGSSIFFGRAGGVA